MFVDIISLFRWSASCTFTRWYWILILWQWNCMFPGNSFFTLLKMLICENQLLEIWLAVSLNIEQIISLYSVSPSQWPLKYKMQRCKNETRRKNKIGLFLSNHNIELQWDSSWSRPRKFGCFVGLPRCWPHQRSQTGLSKMLFTMCLEIDGLCVAHRAAIVNQVRREEKWREEPEEICRLAFLSEKILHGGWMMRNLPFWCFS